MADKIEISYDQVFSMVKSLNKEEKTMTDFEKEYACSRKSIQRRFKEFGYTYDRATKLWTLSTETKDNKNIEKSISNQTKPYVMKEKTDIINVTDEEEKGIVGRPKEYTTISSEAEEQGLTLIVKRTYNIPKELDKDIKIYAALSDKKPAEVVREALEQYINKHYKLKDIIEQDIQR